MKFYIKSGIYRKVAGADMPFTEHNAPLLLEMLCLEMPISVGWCSIKHNITTLEGRLLGLDVLITVGKYGKNKMLS